MSRRLASLATPRTDEPDAFSHRAGRRSVELPTRPPLPTHAAGPDTLPAGPPISAAAAIDARDLYRFRHEDDGGEPWLRGVSLRIERGELIALIGPNPVAARALIECLAGIEEPAAGWVTVCGERMSHRPAAERARLRARRFGIAGEPSRLLPGYTLSHNVLAAMAVHGIIRNARARDLLTRTHLAHRLDASPAELSPAERLRAELAIALAHDPDILLVDERADEALAEDTENLIALYRNCAAAGTTIITQTADPEIATAATRTLILVRGTLHEG